MEWFLNLIYYFSYRVDYKMHLLFNNINPGLLLFKIPSIKKKRGSNWKSEFNEIFKNQKHGISSIRAIVPLYVISIAICFGLSNTLGIISKTKISYSDLQVVVVCIIAFLLDYFFVFRKYKYLNYFKRFEKMLSKTKIIWAIICLLFSVFVFLLCILSFKYELKIF